MDPTRQAFLDALEANEDDNQTRLVYADWLEEHGLDDEALRQRSWREAKDTLVGMAKQMGQTCLNWGVRNEQGEWEKETWVDITYKDLIQAGYNYLEHGDYFTQMGSEKAIDMMYDYDNNREKYWKCWALVTGEVAPEKDPGGDNPPAAPFSCSC